MTTHHAILDEQPALPKPNRAEAILLMIAGGFLLANFWALAMVRAETQPAHWTHFIVWVALAVLGRWWLARRLPAHDPLLFPLAMFLSGWGLLLIDRLAQPFAERQTVWLAVSVTSMLVTATFPQPLRWLRSYRYTLLVSGLVLLFATIVLGRNPSGQAGAPELWLGVGSLFFQPSEPLKIILVAFLASYLAEQYPALRAERLSGNLRTPILAARVTGPILLMWGICIVILVWQRDLGTASLFFIVFLILLYTASGSILTLLSGIFLTLIAAFAAYHLFDVVALRVDIWLNPWPEADNRAYQIVQSLQAFAAGGILGQGIGQGWPTYVPVVHSDFVFAALAEEWGLIGVIVVIACLALLVMRGLYNTIRQNGHSFRALLGIGLSMLIGVQSLMIMGGVLKLIPLTGVTLPFLSYGGSSLLVSFVMIGFLLRLSASEEAGYAAHS